MTEKTILPAPAARPGLSGSAIKGIALALMFIDHIWQFLRPLGIPLWFTWLGRISAPLFFFTAAEGFAHTRDRRRYMLRLYLFSAGVGLMGCISRQPALAGRFAPFENNIFQTLFLMMVLIRVAEELLCPAASWGRRAAVLAAAAAGLAVAPWALPRLVGAAALPWLQAVLPSFLWCEGGWVWAAFGTALYFARGRGPWALCGVVAVFSALVAADWGAYQMQSFGEVMQRGYGWMMVFSLPVLLLYNGQRGRGMKYLFYVFYPAHLAALSWLAALLV